MQCLTGTCIYFENQTHSAMCYCSQISAVALYVNKELISVTSLQTLSSQSDNIRTHVYYTKNGFILKNSGIFRTKRKYV